LDDREPFHVDLDDRLKQVERDRASAASAAPPRPAALAG
jgi:hypothetical protein